MSWKAALVATAALVVPYPAVLAPERANASAAGVAPSVETPPPPPPAARVVTPLETWSSSRDARDLAAGEAHVWVATGGGLERYAKDGHERRHFGVEDGLDTLDVRAVEATPAGIVARTASGRCELAGERFRCAPAKAAPPRMENLTLFRGHPVNTRLRVGRDAWIATRGGGAFFSPAGDDAHAVPLDGTANAPSSFVHTGAVFAGALWLGTFADGLLRVPLDPRGDVTGPLATTARAVSTPARMVNRIVATSGKDAALFVGASEGLFVSRDGVTFTRVPAIHAHAITGLAATDRHLWVASTEAVWRLPASGRGPVQRSFVRPAGSHAIQSVAVDEQGAVWLATEDRGVVRIDADGAIQSFDRVAGLPTSWFVAVASDGAGGALASSLRHGSVHITRDNSWKTIAWAPSPWGLGVHRDATRTCLATQGGARCVAGSEEIGMAGLPDPRVHLVLPVGKKVMVGTEAGVAVFGI